MLRISILLALALVASGARKVVREQKNSFCTFAGYKPGERATISTTTTPIASLQTSVLQDIFTDSTLGAISGGINALSGLSGGTLGTALGVVTGVFGTIAGYKTPTYSDILKETNDAIKQLAEEIDLRMDEMQEYVDREIIKLLKDINEHKYKFLFTYWAGCVRGPPEEQKLCQQEAVNLIQASISEFAMFNDQVDLENEEFHRLSEEKQKRLEVNLVLFRNYAFLSLMSLQVMKKSYEGDTTVTGRAYTKMYHCMLRSKIKFYKSYVKAAVKEIVKLNSKYEPFGNIHVTTKVESEFSNRKTKVVTCQAKMSPRITGDNPCRLLLSVSIYSKKRAGIELPGLLHPQYAQIFCRHKLHNYFNNYKVDEANAVNEFWKEEVSKVIEKADSLVNNGQSSTINCDAEM